MKNKALFIKKENTGKEQIIKQKEKEIQKLYDESIMLKCKADFQSAKDKCRQANSLLQNLKQKNQEYLNVDLDLGIRINLALIYQAMGQVEDAINVYQDILRVENYYSLGNQHHKVRVNIGNIYMEQGKFAAAITEYKKALNLISKDNKELRANILKNVGLAYVKLEKYDLGIDSFEESFKNSSDEKTALNLLLCHLGNGDIAKTKDVYNTLLEKTKQIVEEDEDNPDETKASDSLQEYYILKKKNVYS